MQGKVVLITGAKGGLGNYVTQAFLGAGAVVAGVSRSIKQSDFPHPNFTAVAGELTSSNSAAEVAGAGIQKFGRIDALVHLVGGFGGVKPLPETDDATFEEMSDLNFRSAFYIAKAVLPHMRRAGSGRIVAIGSRAGLEPSPGIGPYAAAKAALISLIRTIAVENKDAGITANVLLPGTIDTPANRAADPNADTSKWINPEKLAALILWLAGDGASQLSGAVIPVYGRDI
ncbi:MAG: SDR family oxidoreductase [Acidobacteriales bacterium]|nr:SDR family oxidoreductase [Terriglobales bacterium]